MENMSECTVCKIVLFPHDLEPHMKGKRHLKNLSKGSTDIAPKAVGVKEGSSQSGTSSSTPKKQPPVANPARKPKRKIEGKKQSDAKTDVPPIYLERSKPFEQQAYDFVRQLEQTEVEHRKIQKVLSDVAFSFDRAIPDVIPVLYGSQLTGLAFKTSDIDVYLCNPRGGDEEQEFVKRHGKSIYRSRMFSNIILVTKARVPVIKAKHIHTGIELDISATSGQAVANSVLIRYILSYDSRIRIIMMIIGYWAKKCQLISVSRFSRYAINLLIIFYLQNISDPLLPPLCNLVHGIPGKTWPFRIYEDTSLLINNNTLPLYLIFIGFFEFYQHFNFTNFVISTYLGCKIPASDMDKPEVLEAMSYYKAYLMYGNEPILQRDICIQDPLEMSQNTSKSVNGNVIEQFQLACTKMIDMKDKVMIDDWLYELVNGKVAAPIAVKGPNKLINFDLLYKTSENWKEDFEKDFTEAFKILNIKLESYASASDKSKKTKLDPDCLAFALEATINPFTQDLKQKLALLEAGCNSLETFVKSIKFEDKPSGTLKQFHFTGCCRISVKRKDFVHITINNMGDPSSFYQLVYPLRKHLESIIHAVNPSLSLKKTKESAIQKT